MNMMNRTFVKKVLQERYVDGMEIDTAAYNYGLILSNITSSERLLFESILNVAEATGPTLGTLWWFVAAFQGRFAPSDLVNRLLTKDPGPVDLGQYVTGLKGITTFDAEVLRGLRKLAYRSRPRIVADGRDREAIVFFWENFYERVRQDGFAHAPARADSYFLFDDMRNALAYANKHPSYFNSPYLFCHVEATSCRTAFAADMTILDEVNFEQTFEAASGEIRKYWMQEKSKTPLMEVLFQGSAKLGKPVRPGPE